MCSVLFGKAYSANPTPIEIEVNRECANKNSGGKRQAWYQLQVTTGKRRSLSALVPESDHSGVPPVKIRWSVD